MSFGRQKNELEGMVDWLEDYEITNIEIHGNQPASARLKKQKTVGRKGSSTQRFPAQKQIKEPKYG